MAKVAIIGGGASGLTASIYASKNHNVTIFERNNVCGKKITITGNGKCNYWNEDQDFEHYHSQTPSILSSFLKSSIMNETQDFFRELGIVPKIKNGYYYPNSMQATSIRNTLEKKAMENGVHIIKDTLIEKIVKKENKFILNPEKEHLQFDKIILACGSIAAPKTGSDGIGYQLAASFGHTIIKPNPTLVQLVCDAPFLKSWSGVRAEVSISLIINDTEIRREKGEIQLTDYGVSGICIFNLSRDVKKSLEENKRIFLKIDFFPLFQKYSLDDLLKWFDERSEVLKGYSLDEMLEGILPYKLALVLIKEAKLTREMKWTRLSLEEKRNFIKTLRNFSLEIIDTKSFDHAQACTGGVSLKEIDMENMQSKLVENLYLIGELVDVDGDCGGYNLGFAWMSGIKCGKNI